jgi:fructose-bisphosphate aldolase class I
VYISLANFNNMQDNGLVPIVEPEILLDGNRGIDRTLEVAQKVWSKVFFFLAENNVLFEGILLKPSMVTPGAECPERATPEKVAEYTLTLLKRHVPPSVPGIMVSHLPVFQKKNWLLSCTKSSPGLKIS